MKLNSLPTICLLGAATLGLCSCNSLENHNAGLGDPFQDALPQAATPLQSPPIAPHANPPAQHAGRFDGEPGNHIRPVGYTAEQPRPTQRRPVGAAEEPRGDFVTTERRVPLSPDDVPPGPPFAGDPAQLYPDEYLYDGGDRDLPVRYDQFRRLGLDTEDTAAEYTDHRGERHVKPSNRVAVYSPRFASVRTIGTAVSDSSAGRLGSVQEELAVTRIDGKRGTANHRQRRTPDNVRVRSRGSGVDVDRRNVTAAHITRLAAHRFRIKPVENLVFLQSGELKNTEEAILATGIQAAAAWTRKESPVLLASRQQSDEVSVKAKFQEYVGLEDMRKTPGELRIVKLADKKSAQTGEVVTFTIRYDNLGDRELHHVRILDNLTPRLEYIEDSATSDRAGRLVVEDNLEGSLVLKFEVKDPLPGRSGGVVTFKAKVR